MIKRLLVFMIALTLIFTSVAYAAPQANGKSVEQQVPPGQAGKEKPQPTPPGRVTPPGLVGKPVPPGLSEQVALQDIILSHGALEPNFCPEVLAYEVVVSEEVEAIFILPVAAHNAGALVIKVNDVVVVDPSQPVQVDLSPGENEAVIQVEAKSKASQTYTLTVLRELRARPVAELTGGLRFDYAEGLVTFTGDFLSIQNTPNSNITTATRTGITFRLPEPTSKWVGVVIPRPTINQPESGTVNLTIREAGRANVVHSNVVYSASEPLKYYVAALAAGRTMYLDLVWNESLSETLVVQYVDTTPRLLDNLFIHTTPIDFSGTHQGTTLVPVGDGAIALSAAGGEYPTLGVYTSPVVHTQPFEYMVMSWNVDTPDGTHVEVEARALRTDGAFTEWLSWGEWGMHRINSNKQTPSVSSVRSRMLEDIMVILGNQREEAAGIEYRLKLYTSNPAATPTVRLVASTMRNTIAGRTIIKAYDRDAVDYSPIELNVPGYSQYIRDPQYASAICSPTSLTMVLEYHGDTYLVEEMAMAVYDRALTTLGGYGNWTFNAAVAGSLGYMAYVDYFGFTNEDTVNLVRLELARGNPVIASVRYRNSSVAGTLPPLDGAPINSTTGHLVVITGILERDGVMYFVVNDSAAASDAAVRHEYRVDQFLVAWSQRIAYIVRPGQPGDGGDALPMPIAAQFEFTGNTREVDGVEQMEFALKVGDNYISLSNNNMNRYLSIIYQKDGGPLNYSRPTTADTMWLNTDLVHEGYDFTILRIGGKKYLATLNWCDTWDTAE